MFRSFIHGLCLAIAFSSLAAFTSHTVADEPTWEEELQWDIDYELAYWEFVNGSLDPAESDDFDDQRIQLFAASAFDPSTTGLAAFTDIMDALGY